MESILIMCLIQPSISKILSFQCAITIKMIKEVFYVLFPSKCEIQCEFSIYRTSQLRLATFPLFTSHKWSVAITLNSFSLYVQDDLLVDMFHEPFSDLVLVNLFSDCYPFFFSLPIFLYCL